FAVVDARPAYDSVVVTNSFLRGPVRIFQLALKSSSSAPILREYQLPALGSGQGRMVVVSRDWDSSESEDGFVATYKTPALSCVLLQGPQAPPPRMSELQQSSPFTLPLVNSPRHRRA